MNKNVSVTVSNKVADPEDKSRQRFEPVNVPKKTILKSIFQTINNTLTTILAALDAISCMGLHLKQASSFLFEVPETRNLTPGI